MEPLIVVDNLSKKYKKAERFCLTDVSFTINKGDKFGIFGPNGAGKTTLISIMCGVIDGSQGGVFYPTMENTLRTMKINIGLVPQDFAFYTELTALQNLEYFGALYQLKKKDIKERSHKLLKILGLSNVATKKVKTFSGGMKRRLNLAIAILHEPAILFLDEPTVGVDIQSKNAIMSFLNKLNNDGTTIIYTSHHLSEAEEFCDKVAIIDFGKIIALDKMSVLKEKHNDATLMDIMLKLTGEGYRD